MSGLLEQLRKLCLTCLWAPQNRKRGHLKLEPVCNRCIMAHEAADEIERLQAMIDRLPTTADHVPIVPGMTIYQSDGSPVIVSGYDWHGDWWEIELEHDGFLPSDEVYSTREAAEKAKDNSRSERRAWPCVEA